VLTFWRVKAEPVLLGVGSWNDSYIVWNSWKILSLSKHLCFAEYSVIIYRPFQNYSQLSLWWTLRGGKKLVTNKKCGWQKRSNHRRLCTLCMQYWFCVNKTKYGDERELWVYPSNRLKEEKISTSEIRSWQWRMRIFEIRKEYVFVSSAGMSCYSRKCRLFGATASHPSPQRFSQASFRHVRGFSR